MDEKTKRPHTINGSNGSMHQRPGLNGHTFMPTNSNVSFNEFPSGFKYKALKNSTQLSNGNLFIITVHFLKREMIHCDLNEHKL